MRSTTLQCNSCAASGVVEVNAEIRMHFPGPNGLRVEPVFASPKLKVCLQCGSIHSDLSAKELSHARDGAGAVGFEAVLDQSAGPISLDTSDGFSVRERILAVIIVTLCVFDIAIGWLLL
jgi:hypothetical protein